MINAPINEHVPQNTNVPYFQPIEFFFIAFSSSYVVYLVNDQVSSSSVTRPSSNCQDTGKNLELSSVVGSVMPRSKI